MTHKSIAEELSGHRNRNRELRTEFERRKVDVNEPRPIEFHFWSWTQRDAALLGRSLYQMGFLVRRLAPAPTEDDPERWAVEAGAKIVAHPECEEPVLDMADYIGSTNALLEYVVNDNAQAFIVVTESGILHEMSKRAPNKQLIAAPPEANCHCNECPFMRLNTLEKVCQALERLEPRVEMSDTLREAALRPLERMLSIS